MAGKKEYVVISVISGLTRKQAGDIVGEIIESKGKNAPAGRGTVAMGKKDHMRSLIQESRQNVLGKD